MVAPRRTQEILRTLSTAATNPLLSGEALVAVVGISSLFSKDPIKFNKFTKAKIVKLPQEVVDSITHFLTQKEFDKIKLKMPNEDFLDLSDKITKSLDMEIITAKVESVPLDLQMEMTTGLMKVLQYLREQIPALPTSISSQKTRPSEFLLARFNNLWRTAEDPLVILEDLNQGILSRGQVDQLAMMYPDLWALYKEAVVTIGIELSGKDPEFTIPYNKLKQVSVLMLTNTVPADLQTLLQGNFKKEDKNEPSGGSVPNIAKITQTKSNRLEQK